MRLEYALQYRWTLSLLSGWNRTAPAASRGTAPLSGFKYIALIVRSDGFSCVILLPPQARRVFAVARSGVEDLADH